MKITLINPPFLFPVREEIVLSHCLGLRSLSSVLKTKGHAVHFLDSLILGMQHIKEYANGYIVGLDFDVLTNFIPPDSDLIGLSVPFSQLAPIAHDIAQRIKNRFPCSKLVMGGVYPSTQPRLALTSKADYIVVGEGENAFTDLAEGKASSCIQGVYSKDGLYDETDFLPTLPIKDLDAIPFADYEIPEMDQYFNLSPRMKKGRTSSLFTSRGCPFACEFCSIHPIYGHAWRSRSAENVLEEIKFLVNRYSINSLEIEDDNFTLNTKRAVDILEGIIRLQEKGFPLDWRTPNGIRIDTLDEELIKLIKKSNCSEIILALEHGDQEMLQFMNKQLDLTSVYNIIRMLIKHEIPRIGLFVIVGYPGETGLRFRRSLSFLKSINRLGGNMRIYVNMAQPYPGTKLLSRCKAEGYISYSHFDNFLIRQDLMSTTHFPAITTPDFDVAEVLRRKNKLQACFIRKSWWRIIADYMLPNKIKANIKKALERANHIFFNK